MDCTLRVELSGDLQNANQSWRLGGRGAVKCVLLYKWTEAKTTQLKTTEKLSVEFRQTSSHEPARENAQGFSVHLAVMHILFPYHLFAAFPF